MRKIPERVKEKALNMWLQGHPYRDISRSLGISIGAMSDTVAEARKRVPDLHQLRRINLMVMKEGASVPDAVRGGRLLEEVNRLGVSLDRLEEFVGLANRIASEKEVEASEFVDSALRLMSLEEQTGKAHGEVVRDFEAKLSEVAKLEEKKRGLEEGVSGLEGELTRSRANLTKIVQETKQAIATKKRLERLGLEKVAALAEFVDDYESLGFSAEQVQRLAEWRKGLKAIDIDPDGLGDFIKEKGSLEKQLANLTREKIARERKVKELKGEHLSLWSQVNTLKEEASTLSTLATVLKERKVLMTCKVCGAPMSVFMKVPSRKEIEAMMKGGYVMYAGCLRCGGRPSYTAYDILSQIGWLAIPA